MNFFEKYFTKLSMIKMFLEYSKSLPSDLFSQLQAWTVYIAKEYPWKALNLFILCSLLLIYLKASALICLFIYPMLWTFTGFTEGSSNLSWIKLFANLAFVFQNTFKVHVWVFIYYPWNIYQYQSIWKIHLVVSYGIVSCRLTIIYLVDLKYSVRKATH